MRETLIVLILVVAVGLLVSAVLRRTANPDVGVITRNKGRGRVLCQHC